MYTVDTNSSTAQGDVYNSTAITIDFGTSDIGFNLQVNGQYLDETLHFRLCIISSNIIDWNAEKPLVHQCKNKVDFFIVLN